MRYAIPLLVWIIICCDGKTTKTEIELLKTDSVVQKTEKKEINSFLFVRGKSKLKEVLNFLDSTKVSYSTCDKLSKANGTHSMRYSIHEYFPMKEIKVYNYKIGSYNLDTLVLQFLDSNFYYLEYHKEKIRKYSNTKQADAFKSLHSESFQKYDTLLRDIYEGLCLKYRLPDQWHSKPDYYSIENRNPNFSKSVSAFDWRNWRSDKSGYFLDEKDDFGNPKSLAHGGKSYFEVSWLGPVNITLVKIDEGMNTSMYNQRLGVYEPQEGWDSYMFHFSALNFSQEIRSILERKSEENKLRNEEERKRAKEKKDKFIDKL
jgi:hypothetical protein